MSEPPSTSPYAVNAASANNDQRKIFLLHVLTGFAILGLLVTGVWEFGGFTGNEKNFYLAGTHGGNYKLLTAISILFEGKMLSLLALVFGAGIALFMQKKERLTSIS